MWLRGYNHLLDLDLDLEGLLARYTGDAWAHELSQMGEQVCAGRRLVKK